MASTTIDRSAPTPERDPAAFTQPLPLRRPPGARDCVLFFIGIPIALAVLFSLVGTKLTYGMPYLDAFLYMIFHMLIAWWSVNLGATIIKLSFRSWRPPSMVVCILGLALALIPAAFMFDLIGNFYASLYPVFAINRVDAVEPNWNLDYLLHFVRYSFPVLPTFLAGVYGYRFVTGVDWYGYDRPAIDTHSANPASVVQQAPDRQATAGLIPGTKLPDSARLMAIKAEQHYIRIWSDQGKDLVRYRFSDLVEALGDCNGIQVHRSWWVSPGFVQTRRQDGRKLELIIDEDLTVPVSQSYKSSAMAMLNQRPPAD